VVLPSSGFTDFTSTKKESYGGISLLDVVFVQEGPQVITEELLPDSLL